MKLTKEYFISEMDKIAESNGYKKFTSRVDDLGFIYQKRVESELVCSLNDKLHININPSYIEFNNDSIYAKFKMSIVAENKDIWYDLGVYGLDLSESDKIPMIEENLIIMFNTLNK